MDEQINKLLNKTFILAVVLVAGVVLFLLAQMGFQQKMLDNQNQNQITVSGVGKVYAKPDVAIISLGVTTQGATVADVTNKNTTQMNAVIEAIKKLGVVDKDIQTTNYNLTPNYQAQTSPNDVSLLPIFWENSRIHLRTRRSSKNKRFYQSRRHLVASNCKRGEFSWTIAIYH